MLQRHNMPEHAQEPHHNKIRLTTPQKPPSDLKLLRKFMVWKLFSIDLEVTSEVLKNILVYDQILGDILNIF